MTIKDIAKACGVSVSTVSRVLNDHPDVSQSVRDRVRSTVERMGYIPNNSARDLVRSQSDNIGVVVRGQDNLFFSAMVHTPFVFSACAGPVIGSQHSPAS